MQNSSPAILNWSGPKKNLRSKVTVLWIIHACVERADGARNNVKRIDRCSMSKF